MMTIRKTVAAELYILLGNMEFVKNMFQCEVPEISGFPLPSMPVYSMARSDHEQPAMIELLHAASVGTLSTTIVRSRIFRGHAREELVPSSPADGSESLLTWIWRMSERRWLRMASVGVYVPYSSV